MFSNQGHASVYFARISEYLLPSNMGCSAGKLKERKMKDAASIFGADGVKIQTVLNATSEDATTKTQRRSKSNVSNKNRRQHRRDDHPKNGRNNAENHRNKSKKMRSENNKASRPTYDSKINAKYDIKAVIGKGSFSRVLRVENRISRQPYALKIIEAPGGREAFEAELSVLRRLNHPNVIKLIEVFESNHKVYMVMELATGGSLLDRLESRGCLSEDDSREVVKMLLAGVQYLHVLGITHRDLKPDNLLYYHPGKESRLLITDFSLASTRRAVGNPYMHTVCGTPQYIAPEIVSRKPYTCAVDIWAVGVIAYIVLCGVFPFDAEQDAQIFKLILRGKVQMTEPVWRDLSSQSHSFVRHLLHTDPSSRPSALSALSHPWLTSSSSSHPSCSSDDSSQSRSVRSVGSSSRSSVHSLRMSGHRRVQVQQLEALTKDPEVAHML